MSNSWRIGSEEYEQALQQEGEYWGQESEKAFSRGIPFSADMRRAERLYVDRGPGLPQQQVYDPVAERIMNGDLYQLLFDRVAAVSPHSRVLVLACGPGGLALELARQGHHVHGIDISKGAIALAERMAEENPFTENFGSLCYTVADLNRIELEKKRYDVAIAWDGLHHILALDRLMGQIRVSLASSGVFIFSDNIGMSFLSRLIGGALYFMLPTYVPYHIKFGFVLGGKKKISKEMTRRSPFEEVSSGSIMETVGRYFTLQQCLSHTGIGYRAALAGDLRGSDPRRHCFLRWLKKIDDWAVDHGLLKGDHVLAIAVPH
ncbi:methyltransferase domain-containing protein [bacterium]|nr:methyltransferase domain-containing protein [bacterium]